MLLLLLAHSHASELVLHLVHLVHCCLVRVHVHILVHIWLHILVKLVKASHLVETAHLWQLHLLHLWLVKLLLLLHHWVHAHGRPHHCWEAAHVAHWRSYRVART